MLTQPPPHSNMSVLNCGLHLTLPLDFVHEWTKLTSKQTWTAQVEGCDHACGDPVSDEDKSSDICQDKLSVPTLLETDTMVVTAPMGEQQTYLCARLAGAQLHLKDGALQVTIIDVTANCDENTRSPETPANDCTAAESQHSPEPCSSLEALADCAGQMLRPALQQGLLGRDRDAGGEGKVLGNCTSKTKEFDNTGEDNNTNLCKGEAELTPQRGRTAADLKTKSGGGAVKRKRGRPRKSTMGISPLKQSPSLALSPSTNSEGLLPPTRGRYSLRGKTLPSSILRDLWSSEEEEEEEGEEYCPPSRRDKDLVTGRNTREESFACASSTLTCVKNRLVPEGANDKADNELQENTCKISSLSSSPSPPDVDVRKGAQETDTCPVSTNRPLSGSTERSERENCIGSSTKKEPTLKKKRMKIDVSGLPLFARRKRNTERKASCKFCHRKFCDFTGVTMHVQKFHAKVSGIEDYLEELKKLSVTRCSLCDKEFDNRFQLQVHEDKVHRKVGEMQCRQCGKAFSNMVLVKQHIRSVHQVQGQGHACTLCPARFKWSTTLKTHMAEVHQGIRDLACSVCGKTFHRRAQLNRHAIIHGPESAKLACGTCGRRFSYPNNLQRHVAIVHGPQEEAWHCPYCGKGFQRKEGLHNHVEKVHYSLYPHRCRVCKAGFIRAVLLEKHMAAQHGEDGFRAQAGRRAHFKYNLGEGEKLVCGLCEKHFFYKAQLVDHVLGAHCDTFPFQCDVCQQVFMERPFLVLHRLRAHAIPPGPEEAECDSEERSVNADTVSCPEMMVSGSVQRKKTLASQLAKLRVKKNVEDSSAVTITGDKSYVVGDNSHVTGDNSYIIKVENGSNMVEYLVQDPSGQQAVPSETIVENIAHFLLAAEHCGQEETTLGVVNAESGQFVAGVPSLQADIGAGSSFVNDFQSDGILDKALLEGEHCVSGSPPPLGQTTPRIFVQCGDSIHELVSNTVTLEDQCVKEKLSLSAGNGTAETDLSLLSTPLLTDPDSGHQQIVIRGGNIQNFAGDSDGLGQCLSIPSVQPASVSYPVNTDTEAAVYIAMEPLTAGSCHEQGEPVPAPSNVQIVAMETGVSSNSVAVSGVAGRVTLAAQDVFDPGTALGQQIVIVDEEGDMIFDSHK